MAILSTEEVQLRIAAETTGAAQVNKLADDIDALGKQGGEAAPKFKALSEELRALGQQQVRINGLEAAIASAKDARAAFVEARHSVEVLDKALSDAKGAGANRDAIKLLEAELRSANRELKTAELAWSNQKEALSEARSAASKAGVDTKNLAAEHARLSAALADATKKAEAERDAILNLNPAFKSLGTAADQANAAFAKIGIRSTPQIQAEINSIQQNLLKLGQNAKVSGEDFDRAMLQAQSRISALRAEMQVGFNPLNEELNKSSGALSGFTSRLAPVAGAIAGAFGAQEVARMAADFDSLNRSMRAITGSGTKAAAEIGYITDAAQRLGLDLQSTSKAYTNWLASIKGTALEGEKGRAVFEAVAGSMAKLGKSSADTEGAMMALGQMVAKGTVSMEELRGQLAERLPGAMQAAADGAGITVQQLTKMVETGGVLAEDLLPGMGQELKKLYGSDGDAKGFVASWNSLQSAVTETVGRLAQAEPVVKTVGGAFFVAKEVVVNFGAALLTVVEGFFMVGKAGAIASSAIKSGDWAKAKEEITTMASESAVRIGALASKSELLKEVQKAVGISTKDSGDAAAAAAPKYLLITSAYTEVAKAADKYTTVQEKAAAAREAEGKALSELAGAFGTEAQQRDVAARAAEANAEALKKVSDSKAAEAAIASSQLAAVLAEAAAQVAAGQQLTDAKKDEIQKIREAIAAKDEEAAKAAAAAESARVHAEATKLDAQAYADNSARVKELADAWSAAKEKADFLRDAMAAGLPVKQQAAAADEAAGKAAKLYGDALTDLAAQIRAKASLQATSIDLESRGRSLQLEVIQTQIEVAKARGRDNEVAQLQIEYSRVQMELAALKAKALRAEAEAQLQLIAAKRAELEASGQMTEVKRLELAAAEQAAKVKKVDADIADELARRTRELKDVVRSSGDSMDSAAGSANRLADSWGRAAGAGDRLGATADRLRNVGRDLGRGSSMGTSVGALPDGLSTEQLRNMGYSSREIEDYQVKQKDAPLGTVNRQQFTTSTDSYALGIYKGLTSDQAKVFATRLSDEIIRANAEASGKAGAIGVAFGPKDYEALIAQAEQRAFEFAKSSTNAASVANANQAVGGNFFPSSAARTININIGGRNSTVKVADQASADALVAALKELDSRS